MSAINTKVLPVPGVVLGAYPERRATKGAETPTLAARAAAVKTAADYAPFVEEVAAIDEALGALDAAEIEARLLRLRAGLARERLSASLTAEAFALIKRVCARELGLDLFRSQLIAARVMLDGRLAEMATGEGKTIAAAVCAATAALAGIPVHVVTANDYLVARDAQTLRPLYAALGLTVSAITQSAQADARRRAYDANIVYCTASELVFDYLRDGLTRERSRSDLEQRVAAMDKRSGSRRGTLLRGLCMALIDEADSILIDEARVPLVLSESCVNDGERRHFEVALELARGLAAETHFVLHRHAMRAELTAAGRDALLSACEARTGRNRLHREETLCTALAALHLYERDRHYLLRDDSVIIIDESTGRLAPGRVWSRGLHRLIELKEGCRGSADTATLAQITYQRFFTRYLALAGMSGTLSEARAELLSVYGLRVVEVPLHRPRRRRVLPMRLLPDREALVRTVVARAMAVSAAGQPVLIGTDSVAESETLSRALTAAGVEHTVLNARHDSEEARIVAEAGTPGRITVATNMAGRGTDIALAPGVAERGGLHVMSCQHNASQRIDRQLVGRCARRGDPGSAETLLSLDKPLIARCTPRWLSRFVAGGLERPQWLVRAIVRIPQRLEERRQRMQRRELLRQDRLAAEKLSLARPME
ncbi:MAG TPA: hypothetical protein VED01_02120 [Burkholderiales bacterium]|nr:hypothetical protein [Burkholderiales bacterium]